MRGAEPVHRRAIDTGHSHELKLANRRLPCVDDVTRTRPAHLSKPIIIVVAGTVMIHVRAGGILLHGTGPST